MSKNTVPLLDGVGMELRAGRYHPVYCQCIAAAGARREHVAGKRLRETMEKHHMRATSAELGGATWFGDTGSSLIDYFWAPTALLSDALVHSENWLRNCS